MRNTSKWGLWKILEGKKVESWQKIEQYLDLTSQTCTMSPAVEWDLRIRHTEGYLLYSVLSLIVIFMASFIGGPPAVHGPLPDGLGSLGSCHSGEISINLWKQQLLPVAARFSACLGLTEASRTIYTKIVFKSLLCPLCSYFLVSFSSITDANSTMIGYEDVKNGRHMYAACRTIK